MIIDFNILCKDYTEIIFKKKSFKFKPFEKYVCLDCNSCGRFHRHDEYSRFISYVSDKGVILFDSLDILVIKCTSCNRTHAVLPADIIPFQIYTLSTLLYIFQLIYIKKESHYKVQLVIKCSPALIRHKIRLLKMFLNKIDTYLRKEALYEKITIINEEEAVKFLILPTMKFSAYFNCHGSPIFLNRRTTSSYPLYISAVIT